MVTKKPQRRPRFQRIPTGNFHLQDRDKQIIYQVYKHRFLNSEHIQALIPGSDKGILRRLCLLFHAGYLDRPLEQIRPWQQGSIPIVYGPGNKGADLLAKEFNIPRSKTDWTSKTREIKQNYLKHTLLISHFMVCLELACRQTRGVKLIEPDMILKNVPARIKNKDNPFSWRFKIKHTHRGGVRIFQLSVNPDKVFGLYFPQDLPEKNKVYFFLEADRATMPIRRHNLYANSYFKKILGYGKLWEHRLCADIFGLMPPRILTITTSQDRIDSMKQACRDADSRNKGLRLFLFTPAANLNLKNPGRIFEPLWQNSRNETVSLLN